MYLCFCISGPILNFQGDEENNNNDSGGTMVRNDEGTMKGGNESGKSEFPFQLEAQEKQMYQYL